MLTVLIVPSLMRLGLSLRCSTFSICVSDFSLYSVIACLTVFLLQANKGKLESTPDEILSMVKSLASPPHRLLLFLQQSSVEWCFSLWFDATIREIDPTFKRTIIVVAKF